MSQSTMREIIPTEANKNNLDTTVALSINLDRTHMEDSFLLFP